MQVVDVYDLFKFRGRMMVKMQAAVEYETIQFVTARTATDIRGYFE
jgi:hypothetical protein